MEYFKLVLSLCERLRGQVIRLPGNGFDSRRFQIF
jgi:hypothetical protein